MDVQTGGGAGIDGNVSTGGGEFVGRDDARSSVNISLENNDHLLMLRSQLNRMEDTLNWRLSTIEKEIANMKQDELKNAGPNWFQFIVIIAIMLILGIPFYLGLGYVLFLVLKT